MRFFTSIYLILLAYIIAALVFWELALQKQSGRIYAQEVITLKSRVDSMQDPLTYNGEMEQLEHKLHSRTMQYIGEGSTFLVVILIGAVVVYTSFSRRIALSRQQNNFMLSVTHELKSPIAAMRLNLQTMERHQLNDEQRKQLIDRCIRESGRLNDLCNNLLLASQLEGRQHKQVREIFDLSEMTGEVVSDYAARYDRTFEEDITPGISIAGDKVMLHMAVSNLLENAVKYTPADKPIAVALNMGNNNAVLRIKDEGPGIPDEEKRKIFNRFYRIGNEETRKAKGTGLGLFIVGKVVAQHGGRVSVKDNAPAGAVFEVVLPVG